MTISDIQQALVDIGWPIAVDGRAGPQTTRAVTAFQTGYAFRLLTVDGLAGPDTQRALADSLDKGGKCSAHFTYREFASSGDGWISVARELAYSLDQYRALVGGPVALVSGYRDPAHNAAVGGAPNSQHLYGNAADVPQVLSQAAVLDLQLFSGIGTVAASGLVAHVDVRHIGPNTTGGAPEAPTLWYY